MSKMRIVVTSNTIADILKDIDELERRTPAMIMAAAREMEKVVKKTIENNWVANGGKVGDYVYSSIGYSTHAMAGGVEVMDVSKSDSIVGTIGVYKLDSVHLKFGRTDHDITAPQIAYWVEFGTSRLRSGARKSRAKGVKYKPEELITIQPKPFINNAQHDSMNEQVAAFTAKMESLLNG